MAKTPEQLRISRRESVRKWRAKLSAEKKEKMRAAKKASYERNKHKRKYDPAGAKLKRDFEKERIRGAEYRSKNKHLIAARVKAAREANIEEAKKKESAIYFANRVVRLAQAKAWRDANKAKVKEMGDDWRRRNPDRSRAQTMKRLAKKALAIPAWADMGAIRDVYSEAAYMQMEVDHIVPLQSKLVCGLHVWDNLQLLPKLENIRKGNRHWPDMP